MDKVYILNTAICVDKKIVFQLGRQGLGLALTTFSLMLALEIVDKKDDLKSYFNFWQWLQPTDLQGSNQKWVLEKF